MQSMQFLIEEYKIDKSSLVPKKYHTEEYYVYMLQKGDLSLGNIPVIHRTYKVCYRAVLEYSYDIKYVPVDTLDEKICLSAITQNNNFKYVPKRLLTYQFYVKMVAVDGDTIILIPDIYITPRICRLAVVTSSTALKYVPLVYKTKELCMLSIRKNPSSLKYVPDHMLDLKMCYVTIKHKPDMFEHIPIHYKTYQMCFNAVSKNGYMLKYVPLQYKSKKMCITAFKQNSTCFKHIPNYLLLDINFQIQLVKIDINYIEYLDKEIIFDALLLEYRQKQFNTFLLGVVPRIHMCDSLFDVGKLCPIYMLYEDVLSLIVGYVVVEN